MIPLHILSEDEVAEYGTCDMLVIDELWVLPEDMFRRVGRSLLVRAIREAGMVSKEGLFVYAAPGVLEKIFQLECKEKSYSTKSLQSATATHMWGARQFWVAVGFENVPQADWWVASES
jgi:hypothetical protein